MKKIILSSLGKTNIVEIEDPQLDSGNEVKLKIDAVGICGSDIHYFRTGRIGNQIINYPFTPGHEATGTVIEAGNDVSNLSIGDRVVIEPAISCGQCDQCLLGREHTCRNLQFLGNPSEMEGCLKEYIVLPEKVCYKLPDSISLEQGVLLEPLTIALHTLTFTPQIGNAAILGAGPIGLSVLKAIQLHKHQKIFVTDRIDYRLMFTRKNGAYWIGNPDRLNIEDKILSEIPEGLDTVFECCGKQEALDQAARILKPGGSLIIVGIPEVDSIDFDIHLLRRKEISIYNIRRQNNQMINAIEIMEAGKINMNSFITHQIGYMDIQKAFELVEGYQDQVIKAIIHFE